MSAELENPTTFIGFFAKSATTKGHELEGN